MEIGHVEISELTGYSLAKIRKDVQRGKLTDLESLVKYVLTSYVSRGLGCLAGAVDPDVLSPGRAAGGMVDSSGGEDAQVDSAAVPEKKSNPSDVEDGDADEFSEFEEQVIGRFTSTPYLMARAEAERQILRGRERACVDRLEACHMEELGW